MRKPCLRRFRCRIQEGERDTAIEQWVFQADSGEAPTITWLLKELDQVGMPCIWKAGARRKRLQREICWEGELVAAGSRGVGQGSLAGCTNLWAD